MLHNSEEVPRITAIDEAVSVVKQISTDASPAYVNAVLDAVRLHLDRDEVATASPATSDFEEKTPQQEVETEFDLDELLDEY